MITKFEPRDFIAIIVIVGALYLKLCGADGIVSTILIGTVSFYFGLGITIPAPKDTSKNQPL